MRILPTLSTHSSSQDQLLMTSFVDPLQDLVVALFLSRRSGVSVTDIRQDYQVFHVEFRSASSLLPHPHSGCTSLECGHTFDKIGHNTVDISGQPAICGDRVFFLYRLDRPGQDLFIQVIDWRKGCAKNVSPLYYRKLPRSACTVSFTWK